MLKDERKFIPLYLTRFSVSLSITMLLTFIAIYADIFNATGFWIGIVSASFSLSQLVTLIPIGWLSDKYDKKLILLIGLAILSFSYILFMFVDGVYSLTVARILQGIGFAAGGITVLAITGDLAPPEIRGKIIGTSNAARLLSNGLGSLVGGFMVDKWGFVPPYLLLLALTVISGILVLKYVEEDKTRITTFTFKSLIQNKNIRAISSFRVLHALSILMVRTYVPVFARLVLSLSAFKIGFIVAVEKGVNMLIQRFTGQLSDKKGRFIMLFVGASLYALGLVFLPFQRTFFSLAVINGFLGFADSIREPASMALFADEGKGKGITSSFSLRSILWKPGAVLGPIVGGLILDWQGFPLIFWTAAAVSVLGVLTMAVYLHKIRR